MTEDEAKRKTKEYQQFEQKCFHDKKMNIVLKIYIIYAKKMNGEDDWTVWFDTFNKGNYGFNIEHFEECVRPNPINEQP